MKRMTFLSVDLGNQVLSNRQCLFGFNEKKKIETKQRKIWDNREIEKYRQKKWKKTDDEGFSENLRKIKMK